MATATLISPSTHYPPQPSFSSAYPHSHSNSTSSISNMMSTEPRKPLDDNESANRQSLPSISEVISGTKQNSYPPAPPSAVQPNSGLPSPFAPAPRSYPESEKHSSPQPLHPSSSYAPRQEPLPTFTNSPRAPFSSRPPLPPVADRHPSPPSKPDGPLQHHLHEQKPPEPHHPLNGVYAHPPPPAPMPYQPGQLPPGQVPLPAYPISPRHSMPPHAPSPYDPRAPPHPTHPEEADYAARARYDATVNRHYESWSYQDSLSRVSSCLQSPRFPIALLITFRSERLLELSSISPRHMLELPKSNTERTRFLSVFPQNGKSAT